MWVLLVAVVAAVAIPTPHRPCQLHPQTVPPGPGQVVRRTAGCSPRHRTRGGAGASSWTMMRGAGPPTPSSRSRGPSNADTVTFAPPA
ncbi:hypothetical protein QJS66_19380 [Kocuria rhizophila]|nr:hypothetical protein QJS66_19380 [Kocuria rhizophila]